MKKIKTVVLTNTRQAVRFTSYVPDHAPNPLLEYQCLARYGIDQRLRDRNEFPINPLARKHVLFAGIDVIRALRVLIFDREVDAVLCVFENTALVILALRRIFRFTPAVLLYEVSSPGWRWRDWVMSFVMPRVDLVLTLTEHSKRFVERTYQLKHPAIVTGYSIDATFFRPQALPTEMRQLPEQFVLAVGDDHSRDYTTLLQACADLKIPLVLRTGLTLNLSHEKHKLVTIISERISYTELRELYRRARLIVVPLHPTEHPGGITSLFEGMAMAKPVICSSTGITPGYIQHGKTGLLVAPGDVVALHSAIQHLLASPAEAARLGLAARELVERNLSIEAFTQRMATAIKSAIEEQPTHNARTRPKQSLTGC